MNVGAYAHDIPDPSLERERSRTTDVALAVLGQSRTSTTHVRMELTLALWA
jgi:hypothetical protein